jgi:outer membrane immunogenic protein
MENINFNFIKKNILLVSVFALFSLTPYAQSPLPVGKAQFNAGVGLSGWGVPIYAGIDYSVHKDITIGGEFSFRSYRENWKNDYYRHGIIGISGNGNYHFNTLLKIPRNFDFYAGLNVGFYSWASPNGYNGDHNSGIGLGAQVGGRYYFTNKVGINLELEGGDAFSEGKFGVSIKL